MLLKVLYLGLSKNHKKSRNFDFFIFFGKFLKNFLKKTAKKFF